MYNNKLLKKIAQEIKRYPDDISPYEDYFSICRAIMDEKDTKFAIKGSTQLRELCAKTIRKGKGNILDLVDLSNRTLLFESPFVFDSYLQYVEINRKPQEKFYLPRKKQLLPIVESLQDLSDDLLDELFVSLPPRVGKTTLILFFYTWIIGKNSELSNLYSAFSDTITNALYTGILEVINDKYTYTWHDVFPTANIASTNAKDETLNIDRVKRYPSMTCRSLYGTLNGACDCNGYLTADDLIGGIEEALSKDRLIAAWAKTDNNLIPRAKEKAKLIWMGTRWSMIDPAGRRMELVQNSEEYAHRRHRIINVPALDPVTDESNFEYKFGVGYSTNYYRQRRASFERNNDTASWFAQYIGEPIERDGTLFAPEELKYFNGILPERAPDRIFMPCDPAWGGGDFVSAPCCYLYGNEVYIPDVVFDNSEKNITQPKIASMIKKHKVQAARFEATKMTASYKEDIEKALREDGYKLNITTKSAPTNKGKQQRIFDKAPEIRQFNFLEEGKRSKEYSLFMQNLYSFKVVGKNKNDDAPDSLAMAVEMLENSGAYVEVIQRPF